MRTPTANEKCIMIFTTNRFYSGVKSAAVKSSAVDERLLLAGNEMRRVVSSVWQQDYDIEGERVVECRRGN